MLVLYVSGTKPRCHNGIDDNEEVLGLLYLVVAYLLAFLDCTAQTYAARPGTMTYKLLNPYNTVTLHHISLDPVREAPAEASAPNGAGGHRKAAGEARAQRRPQATRHFGIQGTPGNRKCNSRTRFGCSRMGFAGLVM